MAEPKEQNVNEYILRVKGESENLGKLDSHLKTLIGSAGKASKALGEASGSTENLNKAAAKKKYIKQFSDELGGMAKQAARVTTQMGSLVKSVAGIAGASVGFRKSIIFIENYNDALLKLSSQFQKYGVSITEVEGQVESFSKQINLTREATLRLFATYEKGFPYATLRGAEKIFKNIERAVGANEKTIQSMTGFLARMVDKFPELQKSMEELTEADKRRLTAHAQMLVATNQLSLAEQKRLSEYINQNAQITDQDKQRIKQAKEYKKTMQDMRRVWQEVALVMGRAIMPYIKSMAEWLSNNEDKVKKIAGFIAKWAPPLIAAAAAWKAIKLGTSAIRGISGAVSRFGGGISGARRGGGIKGFIGGFLGKGRRDGSSPSRAIYTMPVGGAAGGVMDRLMGGRRGGLGLRGAPKTGLGRALVYGKGATRGFGRSFMKTWRAGRGRGLGRLTGALGAGGGRFLHKIGRALGSLRGTTGGMRAIGMATGAKGVAGAARGVGGAMKGAGMLAKGAKLATLGGIAAIGGELLFGGLEKGARGKAETLRKKRRYRAADREDVKAAGLGLAKSGASIAGWGLTGAAIGSAVPVIGTAIGAIAGAIIGFVFEIKNIAKNVGTILEKTDIGKNILKVNKKIIRTASDIGRGLKVVASDLWGGAKEAGKTLWEGIESLGKETWKSTKKAAKWIADSKIGKYITEVAKKTTSALREFGKSLWEASALGRLQKLGEEDRRREEVRRTRMRTGFTAEIAREAETRLASQARSERQARLARTAALTGRTTYGAGFARGRTIEERLETLDMAARRTREQKEAGEALLRGGSAADVKRALTGPSAITRVDTTGMTPEEARKAQEAAKRRIEENRNLFKDLEELQRNDPSFRVAEAIRNAEEGNLERLRAQLEIAKERAAGKGGEEGEEAQKVIQNLERNIQAAEAIRAATLGQTAENAKALQQQEQKITALIKEQVALQQAYAKATKAATQQSQVQANLVAAMGGSLSDVVNLRDKSLNRLSKEADITEGTLKTLESLYAKQASAIKERVRSEVESEARREGRRASEQEILKAQKEELATSTALQQSAANIMQMKTALSQIELRRVAILKQSLSVIQKQSAAVESLSQSYLQILKTVTDVSTFIGGAAGLATIPGNIDQASRSIEQAIEKQQELIREEGRFRTNLLDRGSIRERMEVQRTQRIRSTARENVLQSSGKEFLLEGDEEEYLASAEGEEALREEIRRIRRETNRISYEEVEAEREKTKEGTEYLDSLQRQNQARQKALNLLRENLNLLRFTLNEEMALVKAGSEVASAYKARLDAAVEYAKITGADTNIRQNIDDTTQALDRQLGRIRSARSEAQNLMKIFGDTETQKKAADMIKNVAFDDRLWKKMQTEGDLSPLEEAGLDPKLVESMQKYFELQRDIYSAQGESEFEAKRLAFERVEAMLRGLSTGKAALAVERDMVNLQKEETQTLSQQIKIQTLAIEKHRDEYDMNQLNVQLAQQQVQLMDNLVVGLGASVEMRRQVIAALNQQRQTVEDMMKTNKDALAIARERAKAEAERRGLKGAEAIRFVEEQTFELRKQGKQLQKDRLSLLQQEAAAAKELRDGWVSAINAQTIGTGRISKLQLTAEKGMRQALQYNDAIRSAMSGAVARPGEGSVGFRSSERFRATAGGGLVVERARQAGTAYKTDVGADQAETNRQLREAREAAKKEAQKTREAKGGRGGSALGAKGAGPGTEAVTAPSKGSGKSGIVNPRGQVQPGKTVMPAPVRGGGEIYDTGAKAQQSLILQLGPFNVSSVNDMIPIIRRELNKKFQSEQFPKA